MKEKFPTFNESLENQNLSKMKKVLNIVGKYSKRVALFTLIGLNLGSLAKKSIFEHDEFEKNNKILKIDDWNDFIKEQKNTEESYDAFTENSLDDPTKTRVVSGDIINSISEERALKLAKMVEGDGDTIMVNSVTLDEDGVVLEYSTTKQIGHKIIDEKNYIYNQKLTSGLFLLKKFGNDRAQELIEETEGYLKSIPENEKIEMIKNIKIMSDEFKNEINTIEGRI